MTTWMGNKLQIIKIYYWSWKEVEISIKLSETQVPGMGALVYKFFR